MVSHIGQIGRNRITFEVDQPLKKDQVFFVKGQRYKADTDATESGDEKNFFVPISEHDLV